MDRANSAYAQLKTVFERASQLRAAENILFWESRTMMPASAAPTRAKVMSALRTAVNQQVLAPQVGELLDSAEEDEQRTLGPWDVANLREMRRRWRHANAVPAELQSAIAEHSGRAQAAWAEARANNDFGRFEQPLRELLNLQIEAAHIKAEILGLAPYDALIDEHEPGARAALINPMFDDLAVFLPDLMARIVEKRKGAPAEIPLPGPFPDDVQRKLSEALATRIGFDLNRGRLDTTLHPFASPVPGDIRITTRFKPDDLLAGIIATIHETGHAMYEAGLPEQWNFQPVGSARGGGMHESQSLIFEMQASRSQPFLRYLAALLRRTFGENDPAWSDANVYRVYRRVEPTFIRVEADEVTYPLHIILRYRIENAILRRELDVADIPGAWSRMSKDFLGITPPTDTLGCLQDIHWAMGLFGYFPTYTLGAMTAAQLFARARKDEPDLLEALGKGDFSPLLRWTRATIHSQASFYATSEETLIRATGKPLSTVAFKAHLEERYLNE